MIIQKDRQAKRKHEIVTFARRMRLNPTPAEELLWECLAHKQLANIRFRRQAVIFPWIVDFYSPKLKLVIEVDGDYHKDPEQIVRDNLRTLALQNKGLKVIRFENQQVLGQTKKTLHHIIRQWC